MYRPGWFGPNGDIDALDPASYLLLDVFNPVYGQISSTDPGPNTNREEEMNGVGVYVQDQIDLTDKLKLIRATMG